MHTKEEITKKRTKSSEQLDLTVGTISAADRHRHQRRWLYLALFITTGLSLLFWLYRTLKTVSFPSKLPQISFNLNHSPSDRLVLNSQLSDLLSRHPDIIGFYLSRNHPAGSFSSGTIAGLNPNALKSSLASQAQIPKAPDAALLPEGVAYREHFENTGNYITLTALVANPLDQIFILVRFNGPLNSLKTLLPDLISAAYWTVSSN